MPSIENESKMNSRPLIAIVNPNTLAVIGLRQLLQQVLPIMEVSVFRSFEELMLDNPEQFFHYFIPVSLVLEHRHFFLEHQNKTIILTTSTDPHAQLNGFHSVCINVPEDQLVKSFLILEQYAHGKGQHLPTMPKSLTSKILSDREIEVLCLIVQGYINKEIASQLNIGMTTVITHRKNIMEKLGMKSVSSLTIYAVMNGYVDINKI